MSTKATRSPQQHKRADTYEGPQMNFRFPSEEELVKQTDNPPKLTGPPIQPFFTYDQSQAQMDSFSHTVPPPRYESTSYFKHHTTPSLGQSTINSKTISHSGTASFSIPTQDNISLQITSRSGEPSYGLQTITDIPEESQSYNTSFSREPRVQPPFVQRRPSMIKKGSSGRRSSLKRQISVQRSESLRSESRSLYSQSALKRSKAVKYKIGWLTRLKNMAKLINNKLKKWRVITKRKLFNFNKPKFNKNSISMPLERDRAQSISELKREINEWHKPREPLLIQVEAPPSAQYRLVSDSSSSTTLKRVPPPLPPHRIASNPSIKKMMEEDQVKAREVSNLHHRFSFDSTDLSTSPKACPSNPISINDEDEDHYDGFESDSTIDGSEEESLTEDNVREYWNVYLRKVISQRIESKIEIWKLSQIREPEDATNYAENVFGHVGESDSDDELSSATSDFANADLESLTSVSTSEFSTEGSYLSTDIGTNYYSTYSNEPFRTPQDILRYQEEFMNRHYSVGVKRSSTLPNKSTGMLVDQSIQAHNRFLSVIT